MTKCGKSPWVDRFPKSRLPSYPRQRGHLDTDVAIVGGGLTGCATAYALGAAGVNVVLIEADQIGRGGTGSGAGWIADDPGVSFADLEKALGSRSARRAWQAWHRAGLDFAAALRRLNIKCALEPRSSVTVATSAEQVGRLKREQKARRDAGLEAPLVNARMLGADVGLAAPAGIRARDGATIDPYRAALGLAAAAIERGAQVLRALRPRCASGSVAEVGRRPDRGRCHPGRSRRGGNRLADAAVQGASAPFLVPVCTFLARSPPGSRPETRKEARPA